MSSGFDAVRSLHLDLIKMVQKNYEEDHSQEAQKLIESIINLGEVEANDEFRQRLESYAAYWGNYIFQKTKIYPQTTLLQLKQDLAESQKISITNFIIELPDLPAKGVLPELGPLPIGSRLFLPRNQLFLGRETDLHNLAAALLYNNNEKYKILLQPVGIAGMGGIGKTQIAVEFCYRWGQFCEGIHWINSQNPDAIGAEIASCGLAMGIEPWPEKQDEQIEKTIRAWANSKRRIIVFDNMEDPEVLGNWLSRLNSVRILITTRRIEWPLEFGLRIQRLEPFSSSESLQLLRKLSPRLINEKDETLHDLAEILGFLPLAIDLAGRYLQKRENFSPVEYKNALQQRGVFSDRSMNVKEKNIPTRHFQSLDSTFELGWQELENGKGDSFELIIARLCVSCASYCAPAIAIPLEIIKEAVQLKLDPAKKDLSFSEIFDLGIDHAYNLGLLDPSEGAITIHPLLAEFCRRKDEQLPEPERILPKLADAFVTLSSKALDSRIPTAFDILRVHLEAAIDYIEAAKPELGAVLLNNPSCYLAVAR